MDAYVIGNVAIDETLAVSAMPKPGASILGTEQSRDLGGKGANQAVVMARCGLRTHLVAGVGVICAAIWSASGSLRDRPEDDRAPRGRPAPPPSAP
jgi:hypothetical protein